MSESSSDPNSSFVLAMQTSTPAMLRAIASLQSATFSRHGACERKYMLNRSSENSRACQSHVQRFQLQVLGHTRLMQLSTPRRYFGVFPSRIHCLYPLQAWSCIRVFLQNVPRKRQAMFFWFTLCALYMDSKYWHAVRQDVALQLTAMWQLS